ncbi:MAG: outer membrane beta-barrel protein [Pseudomonadota bacterium]
MKLTLHGRIAACASSAAALGVALMAGATAHAAEQCFDKGTLSYVDCPQPAPPPPAPAPIPEPTERNGLYLGLRGGFANFTDSDFTFAPGAAVESEYNVGYAVSGLIGYEFVEVTPGIDLRSELELGYKSAEVDVHNLNGAGQPGSTGDTSALFGFLNLYTDIGVTEELEIILGGGGGYSSVEFEDFGIAAVPNVLDDDDGAWGYHLDAGLGFALSPDITLEAMYRYVSFLNAEVTTAAGTANDIDVNSHQGLAGLRYKF